LRVRKPSRSSPRSERAQVAVLANIATGIVMANHPSAVIGRTPLYLPPRVDNWYDAIELTTELAA
jgi:hypothetical protein